MGQFPTEALCDWCHGTALKVQGFQRVGSQTTKTSHFRTLGTLFVLPRSGLKTT